MPHDEAYHLAQSKIEQARRSKATELDFSQMGLTELPETLGQLTQLQSLVLSRNRLNELPEWLGKLTLLHNLNVGGNQLTILPKWVYNLKRLHTLSLYANQLIEIPKEIQKLSTLKSLNLFNNNLRTFPEHIINLKSITDLTIGGNNFSELPNTMMSFSKMESLRIGTVDAGNPLGKIPEFIRTFKSLKLLWVDGCNLFHIPDWLSELTELKYLSLSNNHITNLPSAIAQLENLKELKLNNNPLNPELAKAYEDGLDAVKAYLRVKAESQITLTEAKLILVGEGEVGKSCLLDSLLDKSFQSHDSTHGIEIQSFKTTNPDTQAEITLNAWDFGGQRVYRPTHQLFFSAPAVYLVVWKPREGSQAGQVKEWIQLIKRREPSAKILVVATHGGPQQRQPDIDRQELWDLFGKDSVVDFFFVESKPDEHGNRKGIDELKRAIA